MHPLSAVTMWLPKDRPHFLELMGQGRRARRYAEADPRYTAAMDQAGAAISAQVTSAGVQLDVPAVGEGFMLGLMVGMATIQANPGAEVDWVAGGVMAYALRAVEGVA